MADKTMKEKKTGIEGRERWRYTWNRKKGKGRAVRKLGFFFLFFKSELAKQVVSHAMCPCLSWHMLTGVIKWMNFAPN